jgi:glutathione S-transferase
LLTLYHFGPAIGAQKVRLALAEKGLVFESRNVGGALRDPAYLALNPNGVVPTLVHDERVLLESRIISEYLEEAFPDPALMPKDPYDRYWARYWSKLSDDSLHLNVFTLSFVSYMRDIFLAVPEETRAQALPGHNDPVKRQRCLELLREGYSSPHVLTALRRFAVLLDEMENGLENRGPWLAGSQYSLADADIAPYLNRLSLLGLESHWLRRPAVRDWFDRVRARPSYESAITRWVTSAERESDEAMSAKLRPIYRRLSKVST